MRETNPVFMNGIPELLVLRFLRDREMYGYELVQTIRNQTAAGVSLSEGVVYPVLHGLERAGALQSQRKSVQGRSRVYYTITPIGLRRLAELSGTWTKLSNIVQQVLVGGRYVQAI